MNPVLSFQIENGRTGKQDIPPPVIPSECGESFEDLPTLEQKLKKSDMDMLGRFGETIFDFRNLKDTKY